MKNFTMTQQESDDLKLISDGKMPVINVRSIKKGQPMQEQNDKYWTYLGLRLEFDIDTVQPIEHGSLVFQAEPLTITKVKPKEKSSPDIIIDKGHSGDKIHEFTKETLNLAKATPEEVNDVSLQGITEGNKNIIKSAMDKYDTLQKIVDHLEECEYRTEMGPISKNVAFLKLKELAKHN